MSPPPDLAPMLPTPALQPFDSEEHIFELRWGGIRALAYVEGGEFGLRSLAGRDIAAWFPELAVAGGQVNAREAVLDGEVVATAEDGRPDLGLLSERLAGAPGVVIPGLAFHAYDLLYRNDNSLMRRPLMERKQALARLVRTGGPLVVTDYVEEDGVAFFEAASQRRLSGVVGKARHSPYQPGRTSRDWLEMRVYESGWFVVGGYTIGRGREGPVATLLLGEPISGRLLRYAGQVQAPEAGQRIEPALSPFSAPGSPFLRAPETQRLVYWLRPEVVCEVNFAGRGADGVPRFPVLVTLRPDLSAAQCARPAASLEGEPASQ